MNFSLHQTLPPTVQKFCLIYALGSACSDVIGCRTANKQFEYSTYVVDCERSVCESMHVPDCFGCLWVEWLLSSGACFSVLTHAVAWFVSFESLGLGILDVRLLFIIKVSTFLNSFFNSLHSNCNDYYYYAVFSYWSCDCTCGIIHRVRKKNEPIVF